MAPNRNRQLKGTENGGQFAPSPNPESTVELGVIEISLGYIFDDVGYPGTISLIPDTSSDIEIIAPTQ